MNRHYRRFWNIHLYKAYLAKIEF